MNIQEESSIVLLNNRRVEGRGSVQAAALDLFTQMDCVRLAMQKNGAMKTMCTEEVWSSVKVLRSMKI